MHLCEPFLSGAPHAYFGGEHPRVHREHRLTSAVLLCYAAAFFRSTLRHIMLNNDVPDFLTYLGFE